MDKSKKIRLLACVLGLLILFACSKDSQVLIPVNEGSEDSERNQSILAYFATQDSLVRTLPSGVFDQPSRVFDARVYPAESAVSFLSAWLITGEVLYLDDAVRQLQYARSLEDENHLHIYPEDLSGNAPFPLVSTNAQARLILGYYIAWSILEEPFYLDWADQAMTAFLDLPSCEACWEDQCFTAWHFTYSRDPGFEPWSGCFVNPNQQSVIGLVMTLLYHQPHSIHYLDEQLGNLAHQQLGAALVMMDENGRIPLSASGDDPELFDTRYGHKTLVNVTWAQMYWQDVQMGQKLELAHQWVAEYTRDGGRTLRYYPDFLDGPVPDPTELYTRLPLIQYFEGDQVALDVAIDEAWSRRHEFELIQGGWVCPLAAFEAMGISRDVYWP